MSDHLDNDKEELRIVISEEFYVDHADNDNHTCSSCYIKCVKCNKRSYRFNLSLPCTHPIENYKKEPCDCGAEQEAKDSVDRILKLVDQYTQSKLKAFAGEVEHKLGLADGDGEVHVSHVCPQDSIPCAKFAQRGVTRHHQRQSLKAIKGKAGIE